MKDEQSKHGLLNGMVEGMIVLGAFAFVIGMSVTIYHRVGKDYKQWQEDRKQRQQTKQMMNTMEDAGRFRIGDNKAAINAARKAWPSPYATYLGPLTSEIENSSFAAVPLLSVDVFYGRAERDKQYNGDAMSLVLDELKSSSGESIRAQLWVSECLATPWCLNKAVEKSDAAKILLDSQQKLAKGLLEKNRSAPIAVCHSLGTTYRDLAYYGFPGVNFKDAALAEISCAKKPGFQEYKPFGVPVSQHVEMAEKALKAYSDNSQN